MIGKRKAIFVAAIAAAVGVATGAYASIPGPGGTVAFCYATKANGGIVPGSARIVDSGEACRFYEARVVVNQQGQPGPTGPTGPQGPTGATGPQGSPGDNTEHWEPFCDTTSPTDGNTLYRHACSTFGNQAGTTVWLEQKP